MYSILFYFIVLCYAMLYYVILDDMISYHFIFYNVVLCHIILYYLILYNVISCCTIF